ncbi:MAG: S-layer homology domain-containing protein, partial [Clostridia bacterium]|nr:S-layer homology domain-containing protein [Clostridia bacterium]
MKLRKILAGALAFIMLVSTLAVGGAAAKGELPFTDVPEGEWYYDATRYVWENGLMNGTGNGDTFSPNGSLTRAMVVTVLYRMEGEPSTRGGGNVFCDLEEGAYYILPVDWARDNNIVTSTGFSDNGEELFSPNRAITRQELATMFVRYARYRYVITEDTTDISAFKDADKVASWAEEAMAWCNAVGLIKGTGTGDTLSPEDTASRAQFATIIERFREEAEFEYEYLFKRPQPISTYTEKEYPIIHDADLYVAVDGNDNNPGTEDKPLATFEAAVAKVRELKKTAKDEIVVAFKAGDYGNLQLELTEEDAGSEKVPIKYTCYGDGDVLFSNGVTAFIEEFGPIDESDYYLFPERNRSKIVKADMSDKVTIGEMNGMCQLFSEEMRIDMARYPNKNPTG